MKEIAKGLVQRKKSFVPLVQLLHMLDQPIFFECKHHNKNLNMKGIIFTLIHSYFPKPYIIIVVTIKKPIMYKLLYLTLLNLICD